MCADHSVQLLFLTAEFSHIAEHGNLSSLRLGQHVYGSHHGHRIRIVAVVDNCDAVFPDQITPPANRVRMLNSKLHLLRIKSQPSCHADCCKRVVYIVLTSNRDHHLKLLLRRVNDRLRSLKADRLHIGRVHFLFREPFAAGLCLCRLCFLSDSIEHRRSAIHHLFVTELIVIPV